MKSNSVVSEESVDRHLALKAVMMPRDTNPYGTIFGGVLLSYIDQAGAEGARFEMRRAGWPQRTIVTVAMDKVEFHEPVFVGDVVSFYTTLDRAGRTSITVHVDVETERAGASGAVRLTEATVTYVAVEIVSSDPTARRKPAPLRGSE
jgi:acyl-CoA thioesterase YciA